MIPNQLEKSVILKAQIRLVWKAISDSQEFGAWFGMKLEGPFRAGAIIRGKIEPTQVDSEVAKMQEPFKGTPVEFQVDRIEPEKLFSFKWHPFAIDPKVDYSHEKMTLVTFTLDEEERGVRLTLVESGFDQIPLARRKAAFDANDGGWEKQMELIDQYLRRTSDR